MASISLSSADPLLNLIVKSFQKLEISQSNSTGSTSKITTSDATTISGTNTIATYLSPQIFPDEKYSELEQAEIAQWLSLSARAQGVQDETFYKTLNDHLKSRTTLLGDKPSVADLAVYARINEIVKSWTSEQRTGGPDGGWRYIVRFVDYVQNSPVYAVNTAEVGGKVDVDVKDVQTVLKVEEPVKEKKEGAAGGEGAATGKKGKKGAADVVKEEVGKVIEGVKDVVVATASAVGATTPTTIAPQDSGKKKEKAKKEKAPKAPTPSKEEPVLTPSLIDLRVGQILKCVPHPNADSLYMSTVSCGDTADSTYINPYPDPENPDYPPTRTVLSGLKGKIPIEEMQNRRVVLVCNLKPSALRGIKSYAMVLAASPKDGGDTGLELVSPPPDAKIGERVIAEGYEPTPPEQQLNPKKKYWEALQPGLTTSEDCEVVFRGDVVFTGNEGEQNSTSLNKGLGRLVCLETKGVCKVGKLKGASVR